jgi:hypothetical protein
VVIGRHLLAWLGIVGVGLDVFGGLYLAYDLLGGQRGPLRATLRAATTYAVVFAILYTPGLQLPLRAGGRVG